MRTHSQVARRAQRREAEARREKSRARRDPRADQADQDRPRRKRETPLEGRRQDPRS